MFKIVELGEMFSNNVLFQIPNNQGDDSIRR